MMISDFSLSSSLILALKPNWEKMERIVHCGEDGKRGMKLNKCIESGWSSSFVEWKFVFTKCEWNDASRQRTQFIVREGKRGAKRNVCSKTLSFRIAFRRKFKQNAVTVVVVACWQSFSRLLSFFSHMDWITSLFIRHTNTHFCPFSLQNPLFIVLFARLQIVSNADEEYSDIWSVSWISGRK